MCRSPGGLFCIGESSSGPAAGAIVTFKLIFVLIMTVAGLFLISLTWRMRKVVRDGMEWLQTTGEVRFTGLKTRLSGWPNNKEPVMEYRYSAGSTE